MKDKILLSKDHSKMEIHLFKVKAHQDKQLSFKFDEVIQIQVFSKIKQLQKILIFSI